MFHKIENQENNPENYFLKEIDSNLLEDECFDLISKPRQTQRTIGLYLKKKKGVQDHSYPAEAKNEKTEKKRFSLTPGSHDLEKEVQRSKGFWVGRPELYAPLVYKLRDRFSVDIKRKTAKEQGIFYRPKYLDLEHLMEMAKAGKLYPEEELSDSEDEIQPDDTSCLPLRKEVYKICDPCKEEKEKKKEEELKPPKDLIERMRRKGVKPPFRKIPTGCDCDYFGEHHHPPTTWDYPFNDEVDMLRQHEMNKVLKPFKHELLKKYYETNPPIKFMPQAPGKRTFPVYQISNL